MYYHKINAIFKRNRDNNKLILGDFVNPTYEMLKNIDWIAFEKLDGTNTFVKFDGSNISFHGRTERAQLNKDLIAKYNELFTVEKLKEVFPDITENEPVLLYGEGISHKIQSGGEYFKTGKGFNFVLFDIRIGKWWLTDNNVTEIAKNLNIDRAPYYFTKTLPEIIESVSSGLISHYGDFFAEGVVCKPVHQLFARNGERIITKIKHVDFYGQHYGL